MPIKPGESEITIAGGDLLVDAISYSCDYQFFERPEFSSARLRQAPEADGQQPVYQTLPGGVVAQLSDGCVPIASRPLGADDPDAIYKRWDIKRWTMQGAASDVDEVATTFAVYQTHKALLAKFESHLQKARANISYAALVAMQAETFAYLSATGTSMAGMALGTGSASATISNIILVQFAPDVDYEEPTNEDGDESLILQKWTAVIETRVLRLASDSIF